MKPPCVLIVDDSRTIRRALESILDSRGYSLEFAEDGREAIEKASSTSPDLILLDYVLPDMRGPDVCAVLSALPATAATPIILVSAKGASIRQAYQDSQNVVSYITKPFKTPVVLSVVANALEESSSISVDLPTPASGETADLSRSSAPASTADLRLGQTFSTLLDQLESAAAEMCRSNATEPRPAAGKKPLEVAHEHLRTLGEYLARETTPSLPPEPGGSCNEISPTLFETHRLLCEAMLALAASGKADASASHPPDAILAIPASHELYGQIRIQTRARPGVLLIDRGFESLPTLLRLVRPRVFGTVGQAHPTIEKLLQQDLIPGLQRLVISDSESSYESGPQNNLLVLRNPDELSSAMEDSGLERPRSAAPMELEVVRL